MSNGGRRDRRLPLEAMIHAVGYSEEALSQRRRALLERESETLSDPWQHLGGGLDGLLRAYATEGGKAAALTYIKAMADPRYKRCVARAVFVELSRSVEHLGGNGDGAKWPVGDFDLARAKALARAAAVFLEHSDGVVAYNGEAAKAQD